MISGDCGSRFKNSDCRVKTLFNVWCPTFHSIQSVFFFFLLCKLFSTSLRASLSPTPRRPSLAFLFRAYCLRCVRIFFFLLRFLLCILFITAESHTSPVAVKLLVGDLFDLSIVFVLATCVFRLLLLVSSPSLSLSLKSGAHLLFNTRFPCQVQTINARPDFVHQSFAKFDRFLLS